MSNRRSACRPNNVRLTVQAGGTVEVVAGTQSTGQGHETSFAQVVADQLGVTPEQVRLVTGDTRIVPTAAATIRDRSMRLAGTPAGQDFPSGIVAQAARRLRALVGVPPGDVAFDDGFFHAPQSNRRLDIFDIAARDGERARARRPTCASRSASEENFLRGASRPIRPASAVCEVEVDPRPRRGRFSHCATPRSTTPAAAINPLIFALGRMHCGIVQGAGQALIETTGA